MSVTLPRGIVEKLSSFATPAQFQDYVQSNVREALRGVDLLFNQVLVAIYIRPALTAGGIIRPQTNIEEDVWQGKVGLVLKLGPSAFVDDADYSFHGQRADVGDWIGYKIGDTWSIQVGDFPCRIIRDTDLRVKVTDPRIIF